MEQLLSTRVACTDGIELNVLQNAPIPGRTTCVLIHGYGDGAFVWSDLTRSLLDLANVVIIDLRGHGDSGWSPARDYHVRTHVSDVREIIRRLGLADMLLIGHSLGGQIAVHVATAQPNGVAGMMVIDFGPNLSDAAMARSRRNLKDGLRLYSSPREYQAWLLQTRPLLADATARWIAEKSMRRSKGGYELKIDPVLADLEDAETDDPDENDILWRALARIHCPVLIARGAGSALFPREVADRMRRTLSNAQLEVVSGAGHAVMTDNPEATAALARAFVKRVLRRQANAWPAREVI